MNTSPRIVDYAILGGGAAGFFSGIRLAELVPHASIVILESSSNVLQKVRVSGGGRCNITHNCFEVSKLVQNYPRGERELKSVFSRFQPKDMLKWLEDHGVPTKIEDDGRIFPISDSSESVIRCFMKETERLGVKVFLNHLVQAVKYNDESLVFEIEFSKDEKLICRHLLLATGSSKTGRRLAESFGHSIVTPVPSLFSFNVKDSRIAELPGLSFRNVKIEMKFEDKKFKSEGPALITHWGWSGPAILKLSAFAARELAASEYRSSFKINFSPDKSETDLRKDVAYRREHYPTRGLKNDRLVPLPSRYWLKVLEACEIDDRCSWGQVSKAAIEKLLKEILRAEFEMEARTTYKEEFVTAGGVDRREVNFQTMQSKIIPGLYFAGEILDIDAVTGGFNFQNCWSGAWVAAESVADDLRSKRAEPVSCVNI